MEISIYQGHKIPEAKGVSVVIDVLRAFTTAAFAFDAGAKEIILVSSVEEALGKHRKDPSLLLMGEVGGIPVEGFHFGNSPSQFYNVCLSGRTLVQRTSSGTQGVVGTSHAPHILLTSFVVADATVKRILELAPSHVSLIATGKTNGDEDLALADYLRAKLRGEDVALDEVLGRVLASPCAERLRSGSISYEGALHDLELAVKVDHFSFAMEVFKENGELIGRKV